MGTAKIRSVCIRNGKSSLFTRRHVSDTDDVGDTSDAGDTTKSEVIIYASQHGML
jgi:hypothetical protein